MSMLLDSNVSTDHDIKMLATPIGKTHSKFNLSVERKIESMWLDAKELGWDLNRFIVFVIEVMTIMHHRDNIQCNIKPVSSNGSRAPLSNKVSRVDA